MNALETNRQLVLNYKKQILSVLEASYRDLSNSMKNSSAMDNSNPPEKLKNETSNLSTLPSTGVSNSLPQDKIIAASDVKEFNSVAPNAVNENIEGSSSGIPGVQGSAVGLTFDPVAFQAQQGTFALSNKGDGAAALNPYLAGGLDVNGLPSTSLLNSGYMLYGDGTSSSQILLMNQGQGSMLAQQGANWQQLNPQGMLKPSAGKEGDVVQIDNQSTMLNSQYSSYLYSLQQQSELQQQYNAALGLPSVQLSPAGAAQGGTSGSASSANDLSNVQSTSYLYAQLQQQAGAGLTASSPQYFMSSSGPATGGTPNTGSSKASKKSASAASAVGASAMQALGMNSYYTLPMNMSSADLNNAAGSVPIGSVINGLPTQHQMSMLMNPALMGASLTGAAGANTTSSAGVGGGNVSGSLGSQHLMSQSGGASAYMTASGSSAGGANASYFLNNTNNLLLSNATGARTQTTPSSGGSSNKVDVLGGSRLLLQQGTAVGTVGPYSNMSLAQQQQLYNLGIMAPQLGTGMGMATSGSSGSSSNKKGPSSLYNQIANKNPLSPYNPLTMPGAMGYPTGPMGSGDMMMLGAGGAMLMKPTLQRASSTGSVSKSKKSKQNNMNNMYGAGGMGMSHAPSLWEQIQPQPINTQASSQQVMQGGMQSQMGSSQQQQQQTQGQLQSMSGQMQGQAMNAQSSGQMMQTSTGGNVSGSGQMNPALNMGMMNTGGGAYMTNDGRMLQHQHEIAAQIAQQAVYGVVPNSGKGAKQPKEGKRESRPSKAKGKDKNNVTNAVMGPGGTQMYVNANGMMTTGDGMYAMMGGLPGAVGQSIPPGVMMQGVPGMKDGAMGIKIEGGSMTMVPTAAPAPVKPTKEEGVTALNKKRETVVSKLMMLENSKALGRRSVAVPFQAPPGGRRKVHGDYLLDEMQFLAIDYRQELRTKLAVLKSIAMACAEALASRKSKTLREIASDIREEYQASRELAKQVAGKMSQMVFNCWSASERQILSQLHGKGNLKSLETVPTKLKDELFLPRIKSLLIHSVSDIQDIALVDTSPALLPYVSPLTVQPEVAVTKTQASNIDRSVDRAIDKILKAKPLVVTCDPFDSSVKMEIEDSTAMEDSVQLLPHQVAVVDGIQKLSMSLSFGAAILAKQSAGMTTALCALIHDNWLPPEAVSVDSSEAATSSSNGTVEMVTEATVEIPLPVATVVVVITPRCRLFKWMSQYSHLYSADSIVHFKPNGSEKDNRITPTSLERYVLFVCSENVSSFLESALFSHFLHSQQLCGVMVDLRDNVDSISVDGTRPADDAAWMVSLATQLNPNKSIYRVTVSSMSYSMTHYDVPSLLAFLAPQIPYTTWCSKYPINKANLVALDADGDFLHTDIINRNTVNQMICNISIQCKVQTTADHQENQVFVEEILDVEMSKEQAFKYHAVASLLVNESSADVCDPQTVANSLVLLQRVCFHEQFVGVYDVDSKWHPYDSYSQPLVMGGGYGYSPTMYMGVPYANALSPHFGQHNTTSGAVATGGAGEGVYLSSSRFSFTNQQQFQTAIYSPPHPSTAGSTGDAAGALPHASNPMLLPNVYGSSGGVMMPGSSTPGGTSANVSGMGNNYVIPRHMSFDSTLNTTSMTTAAAPSGSADPVASGSASSSSAASSATAHSHALMLPDLMTHAGQSYPASTGSYSPRRKPKNFAFFQSSAVKKLKSTCHLSFASSVCVSSKLKALGTLLGQQKNAKVLVVVQDAEELAVVHQQLINDDIDHLQISSSDSSGWKFSDQEIARQFNTVESCRVLVCQSKVFSNTSNNLVTPSGAVVDMVVLLSCDWISAQSSTILTSLAVIRNHLAVAAQSRSSLGKSPVKIVQIVARNTVEEVMVRKHGTLLTLQGLTLEELHLTVPTDVIVDQSTPTRAGQVAAGKTPLSLTKSFLLNAPPLASLALKAAAPVVVQTVVVSPDRSTPVQPVAEKPRSSGFGGKGTILLGPQGTTTFMKGGGTGGQLEGPSSPLTGVKPKDNAASGEKESALKWMQSLRESRDTAWTDFCVKRKVILSHPPPAPPVLELAALEHKSRSDSQSSELAALTVKIETSSSSTTAEGGVGASATSVESSTQVAAVSVSSEEPEECLESCNTRILHSVLKDSLSVLTGYDYEQRIEFTLFKNAKDRYFKNGSHLDRTVNQNLMTHYVQRLQHDMAVVESNLSQCPCNNSYDFLMSNELFCSGDSKRLFSSLERSRMSLANSTRYHVVSPVPRRSGYAAEERFPNLMHYLQPIQNKVYQDDLIDADQTPFPRCMYTYGEVLSEYQRRGEIIDAQLFVCPLVTACRGDTVVVPHHNTTTYDPDDTYNNVTVKYLIVKNGPKNGQNGGNSAANRKYRQAYTKKKTGGDASAVQNTESAFGLDGTLQDLGALDSEPMMDYLGGGGIAFTQDFSGFDHQSMFNSILHEGDMMSGVGGTGAGGKRPLPGPDGVIPEGGSPTPAPKKRKSTSKKATAAAVPVNGSPSQVMVPGSQGKDLVQSVMSTNCVIDGMYASGMDPNGYIGAHYGSHLSFDATALPVNYEQQHTAVYTNQPATAMYSGSVGAYSHNAGVTVDTRPRSSSQSGGGGSFSDSLPSGVASNPATYNSYRAAVSSTAVVGPPTVAVGTVDVANDSGWFAIEDDLIICMQNAVNDDDFARTETWLRKSNTKRGISKVRTAEEAKARYKVLCESGIKDKRLLDHKVIGTINTLKKSIQPTSSKMDRQQTPQQTQPQVQTHSTIHLEGSNGGYGEGGSESF